MSGISVSWEKILRKAQYSGLFGNLLNVVEENINLETLQNWGWIQNELFIFKMACHGSKKGHIMGQKRDFLGSKSVYLSIL